MKKQIFTVLLAFAFGLGLMLLAAKPSMAVHRGAGNLTCGGCHTMHNSENDAPMGGTAGTGSTRLVRAADGAIENLCFTCHMQSGSQAPNYDVPHVRSTGGQMSGNPDTFGGGGDFYYAYNNGKDATGSNAAGYGHSIGATDAVPPGHDGIANADTLTCTNCHDPHGAKAGGATLAHEFRNLKKTPTGLFVNTLSDANPATIGDTSGSTALYRGIDNPTPVGARGPAGYAYFPAVSPTLNTSNKYDSGISGWCSNCHDAWHEGQTGSTNQVMIDGTHNDWKRHPVNNVIYDNGGASMLSGSGVPITDLTNYGAVNDKTRLPVANVGGGEYYVTGTTANIGAGKVFCLSCHFAHAGPNPNALRWSHAAQGDSTAEAYGIASNVGCQRCHNRGE